MGQILGPDIIAVPSHSAGTITLPPSLLTLGGRQYRTSTLSRLIATDVTLAANTLYFVYAQIVSGVPALRISLSAPSVYKIANPTANLVGSFTTQWQNLLSSMVNPFVPFVAKARMTGGGAGVINSNVQANIDLASGALAIEDRFGILVAATGSLSPTTGNHSGQNSSISPPIPGDIFIQGEIRWNTSGSANFTNTWTVFQRKNGVTGSGTAKNGAGANSSGTLSFMELSFSFSWLNAIQSDVLEIRAVNDGGVASLSVYLSHAEAEFRATSLIKDL